MLVLIAGLIGVACLSSWRDFASEFFNGDILRMLLASMPIYWAVLGPFVLMGRKRRRRK